MYQRWSHLLFLHWRLDPAPVQSALPHGLILDTYDGSAWIGVVPFFMHDIRPWWFPTLPRISNFLELNLRTYVRDENGTPGVWFFTLDCNQPLAVWWARTWFKLPYFHSRMKAVIDPLSTQVRFESSRRNTDPALTCHYEYQAVGPIRHAAPGSLEFFLVERYILFSDLGQGRIASGQVHHVPYPLRDVNVTNFDDHLLWLNGLSSAGHFDHAVYSPGVNVEIFPLKPLQPT
jgi:uncharacterized protein YqjF (DUF2071 family)